MSEDNKDDVKITTVEKVKDPKKVEAGKKLAAMSKQAKEKKASEASNREAIKKASEDEFCIPNVDIDPLVAVGFVGVLGLVVYYKFIKKSPANQRNQDEVTTEIENQPSTIEVAKSVKDTNTTNTKPKRVYRELDTLG